LRREANQRECVKRVVVLAVPAALLLSALLAAPATAAGTPVGGLRWILAMDRHLPERLSLGCVQVFGQAWRESGQSKAREPFYATPASGYERAKGTWTPAAKTGSVAGASEAILFDSLAPKRTRGRPFKLANMGLQFVRGRLYLTGEIRRATSLAAATRPRRRLAVIARPKLLAGPQRRDGKPVPDTFLFAVQGDAKITKPLADALRRARCSGRFARGRPLRPGARLGEITAQLLPTAAKGVGGTVDLVGGLQLHTDVEDVDVTVTPSGGPTVVQTDASDFVLRYPLPAGTATPLTCALSGGCFPSSGGFALPGQLALSLNGQTTILAGLTVTYAPADPAPATVVTGTLDGVPVTLANDPDNPHTLIDDFVARVSAALGGGVALGTIGDIDPHFTATGPL
jgi:hypothetical protein